MYVCIDGQPRHTFPATAVAGVEAYKYEYKTTKRLAIQTILNGWEWSVQVAGKKI